MDLHLFLQSRDNTEHPVPASQVTDKRSNKPVTSWCFFYASSWEHGLSELLSLGFVLDVLGLLGFVFAVQVLDSSFSLAPLIHRLAVSSIRTYQEWQDPETSGGVSGVKSQLGLRNTEPKT